MPGYDVKTVDPLKAALICPECNLLLRDAVQTGDGIRLCKTCFKQFEEYPNRTSPKSKMTIGKECYSDKAVQREILQLLVLCSHCIYDCPWQGQLQDLEGHCQKCVYNLVTCPNPKLIPAEELKGDIHFDERFKMVARTHCRKKAVASRLEDLNCCPKVPLDYGERIVRDVLKEDKLREYPYVERPTPGCGDILLKGTEKESVTTFASHFMNPLVLFQHMITLCTSYIGNGFPKMGQMRCKANSDEVEDSETMVSQASYTHIDVPALVDPMAKVKINRNKVEGSKAIVPGVTPTLQEFRSTFISAVDPSYFKEKVSTTIADTLNPLVSHLCRWSSKVEFGRMRYEPVDDPSDRSECPEAFIPSNLFHHMKQQQHLGKYADFFDYRKEGELRRDIEKLLRLQNCERTGSIRSQWEQILTSLDGIITFLTRIEAGLLRNNETRLAGDLGGKIDELEKMKSKIQILCGQTLTPQP